MARSAVQTGPCGSQAALPCASLASGMPKRIAERTPASRAAFASATTRSTESCATPGIEGIGFFTPFPEMAKKGSMRSDGSIRVSRTIERSAAVRRKRRGRLCGKLIARNGTAVSLPRAMKLSSRPELEAETQRCRVIAALDEEGPIGAVDDGRIGEGGMPAGEVVSDVDRHRGRDVVGKLDPPPELARVGKVTEIRLREVWERSDGALDEEADRDGRQQPDVELEIRGDPEHADGRDAARRPAPLIAREQ